jgi:D-amino-acid dehydrogenase
MHEAKSMSAPVVIIGAGIVGVATAMQLQRDGREVVLIDMQEPGEGASFGNAGCLNPSSVVPVGMPGVIKQVPGWLTDPLGPLAIRPAYLPKLVPWLWHFWKASSPTRVREISAALKPLLHDPVARHLDLAREAGVEQLIQQRGHLFVYSTEEGWQKDAAATALREQQGIKMLEVKRDELREMEPDLSPDFIRGRLFTENGHVSNPSRLVKSLAAHVVKRGGRIIKEKVIGFETNDQAVSAVRTEQGVHPCSHVVLATGAWAKSLAAQLGDRVPLDTERGYHIMIKDPESAPRIPTMWVEGKVVATPMETGIRFASMVEFAGLEAPPNWARAYNQLRIGQKMLPALAKEYPESRLTKWLGFRPSMPDSLPVIGIASRYKNAIHAFGHGHVGLASGPTSGGIVADLIAERAPRIAIDAFSPRRFA